MICFHHRIVLFVVVLLGIFVTRCKQQDTLVVSTDGVDSRDCGEVMTPCKTIRYATSKSNTNDIIQLQASDGREFDAECRGQLNAAISIKHNITIEGLVTTDDHVTINCHHGYGFLLDALVSLNLKNLVIKGAFVAIMINNGSITMDNVTIRDCSYGITCPGVLRGDSFPGDSSVTIRATQTQFVNNSKGITTVSDDANPCADYLDIELTRCVFSGSPLALIALERIRVISMETDYLSLIAMSVNGLPPITLYTNGKTCLIQFQGGTVDFRDFGSLANTSYPYSVLWIGIIVEGETSGRKDITFTDVVFQNMHSSRSPVFLGGGCDTRNVNIVFQQCTFRNNTGQLTGAIEVTSLMPCHTHFENCTFENNFASILAGAIKIGKNSDVVVSNSWFANQSAMHAGGTIYSEGTVTLVNTTMINGQRPSLQGGIFYATGEIRLQDGVNFIVKYAVSRYSVFWADLAKIKIQGDYTLLCPNRNTLHESKVMSLDTVSAKLDPFNYSTLIYHCITCPTEQYTFTQGTLITAVRKNFGRCHGCPFGGVCINGTITPVAGFWGEKTSDGLAKFHSCPSGYCCSGREKCLEYNSCRTSRRGTLCGECLPGYSETLLSAQCEKDEECHDSWVWLVATVIALAFVLFLMYSDEIVAFVERQIFWWQTSDEETSPDLTQDQPSVHSEMEDMSQSYQPKTISTTASNSGYQEIIFYYYQASSFLRIRPIFRDYSVNTTPLASLQALFKLQPFFVGSRGDICPVVGLTALTKIFLLGFSTIILPIILLGLIYLISYAVGPYRVARRPAGDTTRDEVTTDNYKAKCLQTLLNLFLLSYAAMASMTFTLLHCIEVGDSKVLFQAGYITCYQPWQYLFVVYAILSIVPMWIVVCVAPYLVRMRIASAKQVVYACALPLPFLVWWLIKWVRSKYKGAEFEPITSKQQIIELRVISVLDGPFKLETDHDSLGPIYWQGVFTARRLVLAIISIFVYDATFRLVCLTVICLFVLCHHFWVKPFNTKLANNLELASLISLTVLAVLNLVKGVLYSGGYEVRRASQLGGFIVGAEWWESIVLWSPLVLVFLFIFLTQVGRLFVVIAKNMR